MSGTVSVTFNPMRASGHFPVGITLLDAARQLGLGLEGPCNGNGNCGKDLVQVRTGGRLDTVLACKTILTADTLVIIPSHDNKGVRIVEGFFGERRADLGVPPTAENRETSSPKLGIALDIGTTTIASSLVNLDSGAVEGSASTLNPQVYYGHDVMSRIRYSVAEKDGLARMHRELILAVNLLLDMLCIKTDTKKEDIRKLIAAGNATMQHIFLNRNISGIGEYPYTAEILDQYTTTAGELGIGIMADAPVTTFPCMSSYVGGDIVSGLLAVGVGNGDGITLFIDIGTNGEMALLSNGGVVATSCAAGPCFEGMTICCGMRAAGGAIERVSFNDDVEFEVIGGGAPRGICGSGLLDLVSEMIRVGLINSRGRLQGSDNPDIPEPYRERLFTCDGKRYFRLHDDVTISQEDIRQVQLARAAVRTGVELILSQNGVRHDELTHVIIAGGFGYHISKESLVTVGLIPLFPNADISFIGNSSLEGARMGLLNRSVLDNSTALARDARVMELANVDGFEKRFVREMGF